MRGLTNLTKWNDRLAFDVALMLEGSGEPIAEVLKAHGATQADFLDYSKDPVFQNKVASYRDEIKNKGLTFRLKARAQAEELLATSWSLIHSIDVSPAVKADLIKSTVKWAGLEPRGEEQNGPAGGVSITINLGDAGSLPMKLVEHEP